MDGSASAFVADLGDLFKLALMQNLQRPEFGGQSP